MVALYMVGIRSKRGHWPPHTPLTGRLDRYTQVSIFPRESEHDNGGTSAGKILKVPGRSMKHLQDFGKADDVFVEHSTFPKVLPQVFVKLQFIDRPTIREDLLDPHALAHRAYALYTS